MLNSSKTLPIGKGGANAIVLEKAHHDGSDPDMGVVGFKIGGRRVRTAEDAQNE